MRSAVEGQSMVVFDRGRHDAALDRCENAPFGSVGGLDARAAMKAPEYILASAAEEYLAGYASEACAMYGDDWRTRSFEWGPALTIEAT